MKSYIKENKKFMNYSEYDEVINGEQTYKFIGEELKKGNNVIIGWTDQEFTHFDIYFQLGIDNKCGPLQRGMRPEYLYVGIIDHNFYGFRTDTAKMGDYIAEKLRIDSPNLAKKVSDLINGVIENLK